MAEKEAVARKDGKAFRTGRVQIEDGYFVDPAYRLKLCEHQEIGATGRLIVVELDANDPTSGAPSFIGRWDERANHLDFDAVDDKHHVDKRVTFIGHHPSPLPDRHVAVDLAHGGRVIFKGVISFALGRDLALGDALNATAGLKCDAEVIRGGKVIEPGDDPK